MFAKGTIVRLNEFCLNRIYPAGGGYQNRASRKRFVVIGYSRDKQCTRVRPVGGSRTTSESYHNSFLERAPDAKTD